MNRIRARKKYIVIIVIAILVIFISNNTYANYHFKYNLEAFSLSRDNTPINYIFSRTNSEGYTNRDVEVVLEFNKNVEPLDGFEMLDGGKKYRKIVEEYEINNFVVSDISGNKCGVSYEINNIDKEFPTINNIEDGNSYNSPVYPIYEDNVGISSIDVKKYSNLKWSCFWDYYDSGDYKGIQVLNNSILVEFSGKPRGTVQYNHYLNGVYKASTTTTKYLHSNLTPYTNYSVRVDAVDENGSILQSVSKNLKTKLFSNIECTKNASSFNVRVTGLDNRVKSVNTVKFDRLNPENKIYQNISIGNDRSLSGSMSAYDLGYGLRDTYYFLHFQLWDSNKNLLETICIDVEFGKDYVPRNNGNINVYSLTGSGEYDITVTDYAGNQTFKSIKIN